MEIIYKQKYKMYEEQGLHSGNLYHPHGNIFP